MSEGMKPMPEGADTWKKTPEKPEQQDNSGLAQIISRGEKVQADYSQRLEMTKDPGMRKVIEKKVNELKLATQVLDSLQHVYSDLKEPIDVIDRLNLLINTYDKDVQRLEGIRDAAARGENATESGKVKMVFTEVDDKALKQAQYNANNLELAQSYYLEQLDVNDKLK